MVPLACGLSAACLYLLIQLLYSQVEEEDRTYMDPLPPLLKLVWPLIQIVATFVCGTIVPYAYLEYTETRLIRTGVSYLLTSEQFVAIRIIAAIVVPLLVWFCLAAIDNVIPVVLLLSPFAGFFFPDVWLNDTRKRRELAIIRAMPVYLDFITMCVEAGLNLTGALSQSMEKAPKGPLKNEFATVLRDLRSGLSRAEALRRMADRLDIPEVTSFVSAVVQAEKMGSSMASVMRMQADQRRNERFQRAEKLAMEAPVKLIGPLIMFIFPVTFIVLGFPIVVKFVGEGFF
ncbi:MAG: type II secretion system F family protein [Gammaproteobacteria bacterium]|nr:type II secretion system F family protein [Gammaproteobacteria bacterium]